MRKPIRLLTAGPVGSGKTNLLGCSFCQKLEEKRYSVAAIHERLIFTQEDAEFVTRSGAIDPDSPRGWRRRPADCTAHRHP